MKKKLCALLVSVILFVFTGYGQDDSIRTKNDKPGTPQSLRTPDQSPQSSVSIINSNTAPGQTVNHAATGNSGVNNIIVTDPNTTGKPPTTPITNKNTLSGTIDTTVKNSAIQNGIRNTTNPIRNK